MSIFRRQQRGMGSIAALLIAIVIVFLCWGLFMKLVGMFMGLLAIVIQLGVMVLVIMLIMYGIKSMSKKV